MPFMSPMMRVVAVIVGFVTLGFMLTYSGPYRWIAELQLAHGGSYSEQLTLVGTMLVVGLPLFGLVGLAHRSRGSGVTHAGTFDRLTQSRLARAGVMFGVIGIGGAGWFTVDLATVGDRVEVDLAAIEAGQEPPSRWVVLRGALRHDLALGVTEGSRVTHYVPLVASEASAPVVYLEVDDSGLADPELASGTYEGILYANDLPGMLRTQLERENGQALRHYRFDWRETPSGLWTGFYVFGAFGLLGVVLLVAAFVWVRIQ